MAEESNQKTFIQNLRQLVRDARQHAQEKRAQRALETLNEARALAIAYEDQGPDVTEAYATIAVELAMLHQQLNNPRGSLNHYMEAESAFRKLPIDEPTQRVRLQLATCLVNMTGLLARERMIRSGLDESDEAINLLRGATGQPAEAARVLLLGACQNKSALHMEARQPLEAEAALTEAVELGAELVNAGSAEILPQIVDASGRLAALRRMIGRPADAVPLAERAARWAEAAWKGGAPMGQRMFVATQFQLVDVNFGVGRFSVAEDHLWKAVEAAKDLQSAVMATGFYFALVRFDDGLLEQGNLPREEVLEAIDESLERAAGAGGPQDVMEVLHARKSALVNRDAAPGGALLGRHGAQGANPTNAVKSLLPLLKADIDWLAAGAPAVTNAPAPAKA